MRGCSLCCLLVLPFIASRSGPGRNGSWDQPDRESGHRRHRLWRGGLQATRCRSEGSPRRSRCENSTSTPSSSKRWRWQSLVRSRWYRLTAGRRTAWGAVGGSQSCRRNPLSSARGLRRPASGRGKSRRHHQGEPLARHSLLLGRPSPSSGHFLSGECNLRRSPGRERGRRRSEGSFRVERHCSVVGQPACVAAGRLHPVRSEWGLERFDRNLRGWLCLPRPQRGRPLAQSGP